jgi:hypothetical protein
MSLVSSLARRQMAALAVCAVILMAVLSFASRPAYAGVIGWGAKSLPGNTWTSSGYYMTYVGEFAEYEGPSTICVGPIVKNGSGGYYAPWGWQCAAHASSWSHSAITGAAAVYNPNAGTMTNVRAYFTY